MNGKDSSLKKSFLDKNLFYLHQLRVIKVFELLFELKIKFVFYNFCIYNIIVNLKFNVQFNKNNITFIFLVKK